MKFGGLKFLEAAHIKDLLSLLRWAENPRDRAAGFRVMQLMEGVGPTSAARVLDRLGVSLVEAEGAGCCGALRFHLNKQDAYPLILHIMSGLLVVGFLANLLVKPVNGSDLYPDLPKTTAKVFRDLNDRHWDEWEDGKYNHIFIAPIRKGGAAKDIMPMAG